MLCLIKIEEVSKVANPSYPLGLPLFSYNWSDIMCIYLRRTLLYLRSSHMATGDITTLNGYRTLHMVTAETSTSAAIIGREK